jgi:hypothetical protein
VDASERRPELRWRLWAQLLWLVPAGFATKLYKGPAESFLNDSFAAVFYELFWIFLIYGLFCSRRAVVGVPVGVLLATCALEMLQRVHTPFLEEVRSDFLGRALLGTTFTLWDFPVYVLSCLGGGIFLRRLFGKAS